MKKLLLLLSIALVGLTSCSDNEQKSIYDRETIRSYKVKNIETNVVMIVTAAEPKTSLRWVYTQGDTVAVSLQLRRIKVTPKAVKCVVLEYL